MEEKEENIGLIEEDEMVVKEERIVYEGNEKKIKEEYD